MKVELNLAAFFTGLYNKDNSSLKEIISCTVPRDYVLIKVYNRLVEDGDLKPIEIIHVDHKMDLVNECRATGLFFTNETLINSAKILHALKFINENI